MQSARVIKGFQCFTLKSRDKLLSFQNTIKHMSLASLWEIPGKISGGAIFLHCHWHCRWWKWFIKENIGIFLNEVSVCRNPVGIFGFRMQGRSPCSLVVTLLAQHPFQSCRTGHKTSQTPFLAPSHQLPTLVLPQHILTYSLLLFLGLPPQRSLVSFSPQK